MLALFADEVLTKVVDLPNVEPVRDGTLAMDFEDCAWQDFYAVEGEAEVKNGGGWDGYTLINLHLVKINARDLRLPMQMLMGAVLQSGHELQDFLLNADGSEWTPEAPRVIIKDGWQIRVKDGKVQLKKK